MRTFFATLDIPKVPQLFVGTLCIPCRRLLMKDPHPAGTVQELAKMVSCALTAFQLVASTTEGNVREDVRGVGCMLYAGMVV